MRHAIPFRTWAATVAGTVCFVGLPGCGGSDDDPVAAPETRPHDARTSFVYAPDQPDPTTFGALTNGSAATDATSRWAGTLDGAGYHVEVPAAWNGRLVLYAHGYAGTGNTLTVSDPGLRRHFIENGYAWAASSYSRNYYDVRAGVEDTNALAQAFNRIAAERGRPLAPPSKVYIVGVSMGGHIAAAAVEEETRATARHRVRYDGAVPMCGVLGDTELFDYLTASQVVAQAMTGHGASPITQWDAIEADVRGQLFSTFSTSPAVPHVPTALGQKYASVVQNLTGGPRPLFDFGFTGYYTTVVWDTFGGDGTVNGIFNRPAVDTRRFVYRIDGDPAGSDALNAAAQKVTASPDFNRLRPDGLRWVPKVNGQIGVPVVTLHTLGDMYVPFSMEQIYQRRVQAAGRSEWLVQRAIRGIGHCDFTLQEQAEAFDAMAAWESTGTRPAGDDVVTPATVADPAYGCAFSRAPGPHDSATTTGVRALLAAQRPCP